MAKHRIPTQKAEVSGAAAKNPQRFRGRSRPKYTRPLGDPYKRMTDAQKAAWSEIAYEMPWLHSAHRPLVRLACGYMAKMDEDEGLGIQATNSLSAILSKLGATPVDESKVSHATDDDADPDDEFFTTH